MKKYINVILLSAVVSSVAFFSGAIGWINQLFIVGLLYFFSALLYHNRKWWGYVSPLLYSIIILLPFVGVYVSIVIYYNALHGLPILFMPIVAFGIGYLVLFNIRKPVLRLLSTLVFVIILSITAYIGMPNYLSFIFNDPVVENTNLSEITLKDQNLEAFALSQWKGKVVVLDFWNTACAICFRKFPVYNDLYLHYKDNPVVAIYAVNLKLKQRTIKQIMVTTEKLDYDFSFLYTTDSTAKILRDQLNINGVPHLVIIDKNGEVHYSGGMITDKKVMVNNVYRMIDALLEE